MSLCTFQSTTVERTFEIVRFLECLARRGDGQDTEPSPCCVLTTGWPLGLRAHTAPCAPGQGEDGGQHTTHHPDVVTLDVGIQFKYVCLTVVASRVSRLQSEE